MMIIENRFNIGDIVYLKTDNEQRERMVYAIHVYPHSIMYALTKGTETSSHYEMEITAEKDVLKTFNNTE